MFDKYDPYSYRYYTQLIDNNKNVIGLLTIEYQVTSYDNVLNNDLSINSSSDTSIKYFVINCVQKINIFNRNGMSIATESTLNSYENYPALINTEIEIEIENSKKIDYQLLKYTPHTVNTQIQSSGTTGSATSKAASLSFSNTIGSSTAETNSYSVNVGFSGESLTGSADYSHSTTKTHEHSRTHENGASSSADKNTSASNTMSIKDWGAYSCYDPFRKSIAWTFGQEYPWDAIQYKTVNEKCENPNNKNQQQLILPDSMLARLYDNKSLLPPSHLSNFGFEFITQTKWQAKIDDSVALEKIHLNHTIYASNASHSFSGKDSSVAVYIESEPQLLKTSQKDSTTTFQSSLNLSVMALDPVGHSGPAAVSGFLPINYLTRPVISTSSSAPEKFKLVNATNDIIIMDTTDYAKGIDAGVGFQPTGTALSAILSKKCPQLQMSTYFKIVDKVDDYFLYLKHWKIGIEDICLTIIINGDKNNPLTKYVDAEEAKGGEANMMSIALRSMDFHSIDLHDYLHVGLNVVEITIAAAKVTSTPSTMYQIRALSIEKGN